MEGHPSGPERRRQRRLHIPALQVGGQRERVQRLHYRLLHQDRPRHQRAGLRRPRLSPCALCRRRSLRGREGRPQQQYREARRRHPPLLHQVRPARQPRRHRHHLQRHPVRRRRQERRHDGLRPQFRRQRRLHLHARHHRRTAVCAGGLLPRPDGSRESREGPLRLYVDVRPDDTFERLVRGGGRRHERQPRHGLRRREPDPHGRRGAGGQRRRQRGRGQQHHQQPHHLGAEHERRRRETHGKGRYQSGGYRRRGWRFLRRGDHQRRHG